MAKYFQLSEFIYSETAIEKNIDNTPSNEIIERIDDFMRLLDDLREEWGSPIYVTSGYRCKELNKAINGASNSSHLYGWAADLLPKNGYTDMFFTFCCNFFQKNGIKFDQIIDEYIGKSHWVHIGWKYKDGSQRNVIMRYKDKKYTYL